MTRQKLRCVEFFCGIGGLAACLPNDADVVAIDINHTALAVYQTNFRHQVICKTIESLTADEVANWDAELWWMSPPCQPYTPRGKQQDLDDSRSSAFVRVVELIDSIRPRLIALENVAEFENSQGHELIGNVLARRGYQFQYIVLCPTELGSLNRRKRFYLIASLGSLNIPEFDQCQMEGLLESDPKREQLNAPDDWLGKYSDAMHIVEANQFVKCKQTTRCFTSAYGRSPVRCGSYLRSNDAVRLFSPYEILWQLGFDKDFLLPDISYKQLWPLVGNSLALPVVRYVLKYLDISYDLGTFE